MGIDIVHIRMQVLRVGGIVNHGYLHRDIVFLTLHGDDILNEGFPVSIEKPGTPDSECHLHGG